MDSGGLINRLKGRSELENDSGGLWGTVYPMHGIETVTPSPGGSTRLLRGFHTQLPPRTVPTVRITVEIDDDELRRLLLPVLKPSQPADDPPSNAPRLLRPADVAALLGISRSRVFELLASGSIPSVRIGRSRRIPETSLSKLVALDAAASQGRPSRRRGRLITRS